MNSTQTIQPLTVSVNWLTGFENYLRHDHRKITHRQLSDKSIRLAVQHVRVFSLWHEAAFNQEFQPANLTNYDLHLYRKQSLDVEKTAARTWNSRRWALGIFCTWLELADLMDGIEQKECGRASTKHRSLTDDEYHRLVHALEQNTRRALTTFEYQNAVRTWGALSLMLHAGLRVEETSLVEAGDITIGERSGEVLVRNGKGSKERTVPLNLIARKALASFLDLQPDPVSGSLLHRTPRSLQRDVEELGSQIGVPDLTPHWLRYTFAKRLERNNVTIETIRDLLGHNSIEVTRRYLRSSAEELQSAVEGVM